jgi:hypothetical protein
MDKNDLHSGTKDSQFLSLFMKEGENVTTKNIRPVTLKPYSYQTTALKYALLGLLSPLAIYLFIIGALSVELLQYVFISLALIISPVCLVTGFWGLLYIVRDTKTEHFYELVRSIIIGFIAVSGILVNLYIIFSFLKG